MTLKSYLRMLLAAVTLLFVTSGCNDDTGDKTKCIKEEQLQKDR